MTQTVALLLTLLIEVPIVVGAAAWRRWAPGTLGVVAAVAVGATLITHPLLWLLQPSLGGMSGIVWAEVAVAVVEGAAFALATELGWRRGMIASFVANGASFGAGLLIAAV